MSSFAFVVVGLSRWSITRSDVPASDPTMLAFAISDSAVIVSWIVRPERCACAPACASPSAKSVISPVDAFAAPARRSATFVASRPSSANAFNARATIVAAVALSVCAAAASWRVPFAADIDSATERPPFASSTIAWAASAADAFGIVRSLPSSTAFFRAASICDVVALPTTWKVLSWVSRSPAARAVDVSAPIRPAPPRNVPDANATCRPRPWRRPDPASAPRPNRPSSPPAVFVDPRKTPMIPLARCVSTPSWRSVCTMSRIAAACSAEPRFAAAAWSRYSFASWTSPSRSFAYAAVFAAAASETPPLSSFAAARTFFAAWTPPRASPSNLSETRATRPPRGDRRRRPGRCTSAPIRRTCRRTPHSRPP